MPDILIRGMEMPVRCDAKCPLYNTGRGYFDCVITKRSHNWGLPRRPSDCPLSELQPHGDLIDRNKLIDALILLAKHENDWRRSVIIGVMDAIGQAPVIVPSNKEESE